MKILIALMMISAVSSTQATIHPPDQALITNKEIPAAVEKSVLKALSFYPELKDVPIKFVLRRNLRTSVMQAQPVFRTIFNNKKKRRYRIKISRQFNLTKAHLDILQVPEDVMVGWIGHELGHILDYESKTNAQMMSYGANYLFNHDFIKHAEMVADSLAVERGMGNYIVATKRFILNLADLPKSYKDKISRLYLSPDVIVEQVRLLEEKRCKEGSGQ